MSQVTLAISLGDGPSSAAALSEQGSSAFREDWFASGAAARNLPVQSVNRALQELQVGFHEVERVVVDHLPYWEFARYMEEIVSGAPRSLARFLRDTPHWLGERLQLKWQILETLGLEVPVHFVPRPYAVMAFLRGISSREDFSAAGHLGSSRSVRWIGSATGSAGIRIWELSQKGKKALSSSRPVEFLSCIDFCIESNLDLEPATHGVPPGAVSVDGGWASLFGAGFLGLANSGLEKSKLPSIIENREPQSLFSASRLKREALTKGLRYLPLEESGSDFFSGEEEGLVFFRSRTGALQWQIPYPFSIGRAGSSGPLVRLRFSQRGAEDSFGKLMFSEGGTLQLDRASFISQFGNKAGSLLDRAEGSGFVVGPRILEVPDLLDWFRGSSFTILHLGDALVVRS